MAASKKSGVEVPATNSALLANGLSLGHASGSSATTPKSEFESDTPFGVVSEGLFCIRNTESITSTNTNMHTLAVSH